MSRKSNNNGVPKYVPGQQLVVKKGAIVTSVTPSGDKCEKAHADFLIVVASYSPPMGDGSLVVRPHGSVAWRGLSGYWKSVSEAWVRPAPTDPDEVKRLIEQGRKINNDDLGQP